MKKIRTVTATAAVCSAGSNRASTWTSLEPGDLVTLGRQGHTYYSGRVDERTADGRTIWVVDQIGDRRLFHIDDDFDLCLDARFDGQQHWPADGGRSSLGITT